MGARASGFERALNALFGRPRKKGTPAKKRGVRAMSPAEKRERVAAVKAKAHSRHCAALAVPRVYRPEMCNCQEIAARAEGGAE